MRNLVAAATTANDAITDAMELLNRISNHNDWACKEKDAINEYSVKNKTRARQLQENASAFLHAVTAATNEFEATENSISDMFSSVESILSDILSVVGNIGNVITSGIGSGIVGGPIDIPVPELPHISAIGDIWNQVTATPYPQTQTDVNGNGIPDNIEWKTPPGYFDKNDNGIPDYVEPKTDISSWVKPIEDAFDKFNFTNVIKPIPICSFPDIDLG